MPDPISELRISDILTFMAVRRLGSMSSAARELEVTSSQVSKAIARLEDALRVQLLVRGTRGIELTGAAVGVLPDLEAAVDALRGARERRQRRAELTLVAPSYLVSCVGPALLERASDTRFRILEAAPSVIRAWLNEGCFDVALAEGVERLPASWTSTPLGMMRSGLFASPRLAEELGEGPHSTERIASIPFVMPVHLMDARVVLGNDDCPIPATSRIAGHQAHTIGVALQLAARSRQLVFGPRFAAREHLRSGALVEVKVEGWNIERPLHLLCSIDRVRARTLETMTAALRAELADTETGSTGEPIVAGDAPSIGASGPH